MTPALLTVEERPIPRYLCHDSGGRCRAFCYVYDQGRRRRVYLGAWNSPESKRRYRDVLSGHMDGTPETAPAPEATSSLTIADLVARFLSWATRHYVKHGRPTGEWNNLKEAAAPLLDLFRDETASAFGPKKLAVVRDHMLQSGRLARRTINSRVQRIRRLFRWAVAEELAPVQVWESLRTLLPLQRGRTTARETEPIHPVPADLLQRTLPLLPPTLRVMVLIQLLTGMRPNEVVQMRAADIERNGLNGCWIFMPRSHKTEHKSKSRRVVLGVRAQELVAPLFGDDPDALLFTPTRSEQERKATRREQRRSKLTPSQVARDARNREQPRRHLRESWTSATYLRAIYYACDQARIERWSPGRLRHNFQDAAERACGLEAASKALGHSNLGTTEHYRNRIDLDEATRATTAAERTLLLSSLSGTETP